MNKPGWPYTGPCVKDSEIKVRTASECLCANESIEIYQQIIEMVAIMESKFKMKSFRSIFANQLITNILLKNLKIEESVCSQ